MTSATPQQPGKATSRWSFRRQASREVDEVEALGELSELVSDDMRHALVETGEARNELQLEATLLRYLRAESCSVEKAYKRLQAHIEWRLESQPSSIPEEDLRQHLEARKALLQLPGEKGRPLLIAVARNHYPGPSSEYAVLERFIVYCIEAASQYCWGEANPDHKLYILCDLSGLAMKNLDASALRASFAVLGTHYPERAAGIIMYRAPAIFSGLWRVVSPFIDPVTRGKVRFVDGDKATDVLQEWVGLDIVPREYGGEAEGVAVEEAVRRLRLRPSGAAGAAPGASAAAAREAQLALGSCRRCAGECRCEWGEGEKAGAIQVAA